MPIDSFPENPSGTTLQRKTITEGEIEWLTPTGEQKIHLLKGEQGTSITFMEDVFPDIAERMEDLNEINAMRNQRIKPEEEGILSFQLVPNNNPNLQWRDLATQIDMWLRPKK